MHYWSIDGVLHQPSICVALLSCTACPSTPYLHPSTAGYAYPTVAYAGPLGNIEVGVNNMASKEKESMQHADALGRIWQAADILRLLQCYVHIHAHASSSQHTQMWNIDRGVLPTWTSPCCSHPRGFGVMVFVRARTTTMPTSSKW